MRLRPGSESSAEPDRQRAEGARPNLEGVVSMRRKGAVATGTRRNWPVKLPTKHKQSRYSLALGDLYMNSKH